MKSRVEKEKQTMFSIFKALYYVWPKKVFKPLQTEIKPNKFTLFMLFKNPKDIYA